MGKLVYVHGTNGSGKSTLARSIIAAAGGTTGISHYSTNKKATYTHTKNGLVLVGKYGNACGGVDGVAPYAAVLDIVRDQCREWDRNVFMEGLATPGLETCRTLASYAEEALFVLLDTPIEDCVVNVLIRRQRKGNTKTYDPANLYRKHRSAVNWERRLSGAGLPTVSLPWNAAQTRILDFLDLPQPTAKELLT